MLTITQPSSPVGATLTCTVTTTTKVVAAGVASFAGCAIDLASTAYTLHATDAALPGVDSDSFTVVVGSAVQLGFTTQPGAATGGVAFSTQPWLEIRAR